MRGIPVLFNNKQYRLVSCNELAQSLKTGRVKAFRRSTGWALIGHDPLRGIGGKFRNFKDPERRKQRYGYGSKFKYQQVTVGKGLPYLIRNNLVDGVCLSNEFLDTYVEAGSYISL